MKPNREKIEAEDLVKERLPLTKWELTPKEKEDFDRVMRLIFDAASILRQDLELGEDAIGKTLIELADWATNCLTSGLRRRHVVPDMMVGTDVAAPSYATSGDQLRMLQYSVCLGNKSGKNGCMRTELM
jgi:hypothetical protein